MRKALNENPLVQIGLIGLLADLIAVNRRLLEELLARQATADARTPARPHRHRHTPPAA